MLHIDDVLRRVETDQHSYLENKTVDDVCNEIRDALETEGITDIEPFFRKLTEYRYVEELYQLHRGKHIRWMRKIGSEKKLTNGGVVVDIKFLDNGTHILCKNNMNRFLQIKFDDCLIFQKMSEEEQIILLAYQKLRG